MRRASFKTWSAWLAVLALVFQALVPSMVMAQPKARSSQIIEICSNLGNQILVYDLTTGKVSKKSPENGKGVMGLKCVDCLLASLIFISPDLASLPVRYGQSQVLYVSLVPFGPIKARGPPRPPARAPPHFQA